ncbi:hypothetical protein NLO413_0120 [Candidatus Neoehrlichia lotoris str. RAC413]|uniref:Uncharacterized protein n=1 Tax=Candidatus Neoehrlichia procyonis str. RAC413 TaxID=1359163 RepID=A0A0F3NM27_9RICK|nr:hypothetical protein NLO413_0120 [Candidatus Neoehrlichia lotoris str. RAC413]
MVIKQKKLVVNVKALNFDNYKKIICKIIGCADVQDLVSTNE